MHTLDLRNQIYDPASHRLSAYFLKLFVHYGLGSFQYSLLDTESNKFIALTEFGISQHDADTPDLAVIDKIITQDENIRKKYPSVVIGIETPYQTLAPSAFFDRDHAGNFIDFNFRLPDEHVIRFDHIPEINAYNIYAPRKDIIEVFRGYFPEAVIVHHSTSLLRVYSYLHQVSPETNSFFVNVRKKYVDLVYFRDTNLQYFNSFAYQSKEDLLYFTLFAYEQLKLRPEMTALNITGLLENGSESISLLRQYFRTVNFCQRTGPMQYSTMFNPVPSHQYSSLFGLALCGS